MEIANNKVVKLHYTGKLTDGTTFDSSQGREPLEFVFGSGMIIPGLEEGIAGLKTGDKKTVEIGFEKAYGPVHDQAKQEVPKSQLPQDAPLEVGMQLAAQGPHGVMPVTIAEIKEETVLMDFNHPLAGKDLTFEIEVIEVREATKEELEKKHPHAEKGCCGGTCESEECTEGTCEKKEETTDLEEKLSEKSEEKKSE